MNGTVRITRRGRFWLASGLFRSENAAADFIALVRVGGEGDRWMWRRKMTEKSKGSRWLLRYKFSKKIKESFCSERNIKQTTKFKFEIIRMSKSEDHTRQHLSLAHLLCALLYQ